MKNHEKYMRLALELAMKAKGRTSPNPLVGAVLVKNKRIIAKGYHRSAGGPHAEIYAIKNAGKKSKNATLYVTLEPCSHYGRTPPCVDEIIKSKIKEVVVAMPDPNPVNNGRCLRLLKKHGIKVALGVLRKEAEKINKPFVKYITKGMPFITVKAAQSLDGRIATRTGDSKWITSSSSREHSRRERCLYDGIMAGVSTVIKDNPLLSSKSKNNKFPVKIIVDSNLRTSLNARIFSRQSPAAVIIAVGNKIKNKNKIDKMRSKGATILFINQTIRGLDLKDLLIKLARHEITNILVEGGGKLIGSLFDAKLVDRVLFFIAPKIIGGEDAINSVGARGVKNVADSFRLKDVDIKKFDDDILIAGSIK